MSFYSICKKPVLLPVLFFVLNFPCSAQGHSAIINEFLASNLKTSVSRYPAPSFSHDHGFYNKPFKLNITCSLQDAAIFYTTDGSIPSETNGKLYSNSIDISGTSVIRAIAVKKPLSTVTIQGSVVTTRTFLFADDIVKQSNSPEGYPSLWGKYSTISGTAIADYEMDPELMAELGYAEKVKASLLELPVVSLVTDKNCLFNSVNNEQTGGIYIFTGPPTGGAGNGWERPVSFEFFHAKDSTSLQVDCGIQLHGGHSRLPEKCPKHSFRLDFKDEYGPSKLNYPMFGKSGASEYNSFFLRAGFGNTWAHQTSIERTLAIYSRDTWAKCTQKRMGDLYTNTRYAHLFINGMYWGLYNPMERIDDDFCVLKLGGEKDDYDIIKVEDTKQYVEATNGNLDAWNRLISMVANSSDMTIFQKVQGNNTDGTPNTAYECLLDVENFIDYMLLNMYGGNTDWDHHNWVALRNRINPGKGFKFLCWDSEHVLKTLDQNVVSENNANCPSYIFQQLKKNPLFCRMVGDRAQKHCFNNGSLSPSGAVETWIGLADIIDNSLYAESARWGDYRKDVHNWNTAPYELYRKDVQYDKQKKFMLESYFPGRTNIFIQQLKNAGLFPSIEAPSFLVNGQVINADTINYGDIISLYAPMGNIYCTLDGSDPVAWSQDGSGSLTKSAFAYSKAWAPEQNIHIKSRSYFGNVWSALSDRMFSIRKVTDIKDNYNLWSEVSVCNYPNPFNESTNFSYSIPEGVNVQMDIFDMSGRKIKTVINDFQEAGNHNLIYDGSSLELGIYICRFVVRGSINRQIVFRISKF
jgi:hypothetical protein